MPTLSKTLLLASLLSTGSILTGCSSAVLQHPPTPVASINLTVTPGKSLSLDASQTVQLAATDNGVPEAMSWAVEGNDPTVGSVTNAGLFTAPSVIGTSDSALVDGTSLTHPEAKVTVQIALSNPRPSAASLTPSTAAANTPYVGTITGTHFTQASVVLVNGTSVTSTQLSGTTIRFETGVVSSSSSPLNVQVMTPLPGGGTTASLILPVAAGGMSYDAAARFLRQASWGPNPDSVAHVQQIGFAAYIDEQTAMPVDPLVTDTNFLHVYENVYNNGLYKPSQLRQKMMWTWYKLFSTPSSTEIAWLSSSPEQLQRDAFANYSTLLLNASLETSNALALNLLNDPAGPNPNQNFGRELMQLFSTGPGVLNLDGTPVIDSNGSPVPMYTQSDVTEMARAMTGWMPSPSFDTDTEGITQLVEAPWSGVHDEGSKAVLGFTIPAGGDANSDMKAAVSIVTKNPNTAAFMSLRLIHALVSSNPSPNYVSRITSVWLDDGTGTRGNVAAVVKAILLDSEARAGDDPGAAIEPTGGRVMDAVEFQIALNRVLGTSNQIAGFSESEACQMNECPLSAPSVFGYYTPTYTLPGTNVLAPELSLFTASALQAKSTYVAQVLNGSADYSIIIDWTPWAPLSTGDGSSLIDYINHICLHGTMSEGLKNVLSQAFAQVPPDALNSQAKCLLYLTFMSPEFAVNR